LFFKVSILSVHFSFTLVFFSANPENHKIYIAKIWQYWKVRIFCNYKKLQHLQPWKPQKLQLWHVLAQTMRGSAPPKHLSIDNSKLDNYPTLMLTIQILESLKKDSKFWEVYMSIYVTVYIEIYIYTYILYIS